MQANRRIKRFSALTITDDDDDDNSTMNTSYFTLLTTVPSVSRRVVIRNRYHDNSSFNVEFPMTASKNFW